MDSLITKALSADRESKSIEFKREFDPSSRPQWCEIIKDIVAIGNSGGGIIIFGLKDDGSPSGIDVQAIKKIDPAEISNKISSFTGAADLEFEIHSLIKDGHDIVAFLIRSAPIPLVFEKEGAYDIQSGGKGSAFAKGSIYFRHGAKSEPARNSDLPAAFEKHLKSERKSWLSGVRKVIEAPRGSKIIALQPTRSDESPKISHSAVRAVQTPDAIPVFITRDSKKSTGSFLHEQVSAALFEEINNVIDANRILAKGQNHFYLGQPVYFRIYAERNYVNFTEADFILLFRSAVFDFYAPGLFWITKLPPKSIAQILSQLYLSPRNPNIHYLIRIAVLLGPDFCEWLFDKWQQKWKNHVQKPHFFDTFRDMKKKMGSQNSALIASRLKPSWQKSFPSEKPATFSELINDPIRADKILSATCLKIFNDGGHNSALRSLARDIDYIAHAKKIIAKKTEIAAAIKAEIGDKLSGDLQAADTNEDPD